MQTPEEERRLRVLKATALLDSPAERAFDRLTRLAARIVNAPAALVSLVDERRQFFKSFYGLREPWASRRETPLTHSFCQYATRDRAPLIVADARADERLRTNLAIRDLDVIAYAGIPLFVDDEAIGVFCVIDVEPRVWSDDEIQLLTDLAESVVSEIELRMAVRATSEQRALTDALIESLGDGVLAIDRNRNFVRVNAVARRMFANGVEVGMRLPDNWSTLHRSVLPNGTPLAPDDGALARALRGEATDGLEFTLHAPEANEPVWVEVNGRSVRNSRGEVVAGVAVYRDVTERKRRVDLYTALARNIPRAAVVVFDHELRCIAIDGGLRAEGVDYNDVPGRTMRELAGEAGRDPSFDAIEDGYRKALLGESATLELSYGGRSLSLHVAPVRDAVGRVTSGIVLALDVTEQRRVELAARVRDQQFRLLVEQMPIGVTVLQEGRIAYINPTMREMLGLADAGAAVGRPMLEVMIHPDDRNAVGARLHESTMHPIDARRTKCLRADGSTIMLETTARPFVFEGVASTIATSRDLTDELRAEEARRAATAALDTFRLLVESVRDYAIFQVTPTGYVKTWNSGARAIKGYEADEIIGKHLSMFYPDDQRGAVDGKLAIAAEHGHFEEEGWRLRKDGSRFWASIVISRLTSEDGSLEGFAKVTRDDTRRRNYEEQILAKQTALAQSLKEREVLLQEVHHRVKNNLQVISSLINMQVRKLERGPTREAMEECQSRVLAIALIHEKLYQSKDYARVSFSEYVRSLASGVFHTMGVSPRDVALELAIDDVALGIDRAIPCGLVLNELITNSLKHGSKKGGATKIRVELGRFGEHKIRLVVHDDGPGLPAGFDIANVTSMGLQLVRTLAIQLDAELVVRGDSGTMFQLTFAYGA